MGPNQTPNLDEQLWSQNTSSFFKIAILEKAIEGAAADGLSPAQLYELYSPNPRQRSPPQLYHLGILELDKKEKGKISPETASIRFLWINI